MPELNIRAMTHVHRLLRGKGLHWRSDREAAVMLAQHGTERELALLPNCGPVMVSQISQWVAAHGHQIPKGSRKV